MKSNRLLFLLTLFATLVGHAQEAEVSFSVSGGFYDTVFSLSMSCTDESYAIRYTLNGGTPQANSHLYREPLCLDEHMYGHSDFYTIRCCPDSLWFRPDSVRHCIVIRAAAFDDRGNCVSEVVTNSYFIKALGCDTHGLPVVSLCADSLDLFGFEQGIMVPGVCFDSANADWSGNYYQHGREWERRCNVEFYELDNQGVNQQAGLRTHGGNARRELQKGLKIYARKDYGKKDFEHVFFPECENGTFRRLVLKPFRLLSYAVRDDVATKMAQTLNVEWQASRPTVLFIDGEYWGIYLLKEKLDEHCLAGHFGFKPKDINVIGSWEGKVVSGSGEDFGEMMRWFEKADLAEPENYEYACSLIDVASFMDYYCLEMFAGNVDWPSNNMRCWQAAGMKWRWMFFDGDGCFSDPDFDVFANAVYTGDEIWPSSTVSTLVFRKLLANGQFRDAFYERFGRLLVGQFATERLGEYFDEEVNIIYEELGFQEERFSPPPYSECNLTNERANFQYFLSNRIVNIAEDACYFHSFYTGVQKDGWKMASERRRHFGLLKMAWRFKEWKYVKLYMDLQKSRYKEMIKSSRLWKRLSK